MTANRPCGACAGNWPRRWHEIEQLKASSETDFLLDILNRRGFERELARAIAFIKRYRRERRAAGARRRSPETDHDAFGHAAGDQVLKAVVGTLLHPGPRLRRDRPARRRRVCAAAGRI